MLELTPVRIIADTNGYSKIIIDWINAAKFLRLTPDGQRLLMSIRRTITEDDNKIAGRKLPPDFILLIQQIVNLEKNRNYVYFSVPTFSLNLWVENGKIECETAENYFRQQYDDYQKIVEDFRATHKVE
jgi:hypothetical protein